MHYLTREQVRELDRRAVTDYGMTSLVLMENAGRGCADVLCELGIDGPVVVCCGKGNNGGDGFVIARHLDARGYDVRVLLVDDLKSLSEDAAANFRIIRAAALSITRFPEYETKHWLDEQLAGARWIVDALLGTGSRGEPRPPLNSVLRQLNSHTARKLAVDLPSGLDSNSGQCSEATFRADHTCTFVAAKAGFRSTDAKQCLGVVHVLDIGVPRKLLNETYAAVAESSRTP